jgi:hypothetical protein
VVAESSVLLRRCEQTSVLKSPPIANLQNVLEIRIINSGQGKPDEIIGFFVRYMMARYGKSIKAIHILPIE